MDLFLPITSECISCSSSYCILFIVLYFHNYEVLFRFLVLIIAFFGLWLPFLYLIPYFLVLWRVFIGMSVTTSRKLYIGEKKTNTESESIQTDKHWVVAVEDDKGKYIYAHAVGAVISGKGIRKQFALMDTNKYTLVHVGYVTRRAHGEMMRSLVDNEPMSSGNSCQEFAVDLAFQLSSSRTYTFVKMMMLFRYRNVIFYVLVVVSAVLYYLNLKYTDIFHPLVVCNLFVSIELSRIGTHNKRQLTYLPVIQAFFCYPTTCHFILLGLIFAFIVMLHLSKYSVVETFVFTLGLLLFAAVIAKLLSQRN